LHPSPTKDKSTPQTLLTEQHPLNIIPVADWDGQEGSGLPAATSRQGLPPSLEAAVIAMAPNEAPQLLSGRQQADSGIGSPAAAGGLQVRLPHWTGEEAAVAPSPFNSLMGPMPESRARESAVGPSPAAASVSTAELLELLLQAAAAAEATKVAANRTSLPIMIRYCCAGLAAMSVAPVVSR
jgi:hypothetical protein